MILFQNFFPISVRPQQRRKNRFQNIISTLRRVFYEGADSRTIFYRIWPWSGVCNGFRKTQFLFASRDGSAHTVKFRKKAPPCISPSKYKPPRGLYLEIAPKYKVKQNKNGKLPFNYKACPIDFETQISLHR